MENVIISEIKINRLWFINETLIVVADDKRIGLMNITLKEKIKVIELEDIASIAIDFFYD